jgi:hypothetical protein
MPSIVPTTAPKLTPEKTPKLHITPQATMETPRHAEEKIVIVRIRNSLQ